MRLFSPGIGALLLCLAGPSIAAPAPAGGARPVPLERRALAMNGYYMGRLTSHWRIEADGSGEYWRAQPMPGGGPGEALEKYRGHLPPGHRAALLAAIARFRSGAIRKPRCRESVHDAPSLAIRWGAGERDAVDVYLGCIDARSRAFAREVIAVDAVVTRNFVRSGPAFSVGIVPDAPAY